LAAGARTRLRDSDRASFIRVVWPAIREVMKRLGIDVDDLMKRERD
jgi:hypothetical protein